MNRYENELSKRIVEDQIRFEEEQKQQIAAKIAEEALYNERLKKAQLNYSELVDAAFNIVKDYDLPSYPIAHIVRYGGRKKRGVCREAGRLVLAGELGLADGLLFDNLNFSIMNLQDKNMINTYNWGTYKYVPENRNSSEKVVAFNPRQHLGEYIQGDENGRPIIVKSYHDRDTDKDSYSIVDVEEFVMSNISRAIAHLNSYNK